MVELALIRAKFLIITAPKTRRSQKNFVQGRTGKNVWTRPIFVYWSDQTRYDPDKTNRQPDINQAEPTQLRYGP